MEWHKVPRRRCPTNSVKPEFRSVPEAFSLCLPVPPLASGYFSSQHVAEQSDSAIVDSIVFGKIISVGDFAVGRLDDELVIAEFNVKLLATRSF
jgi:hypothetical protein